MSSMLKKEIEILLKCLPVFAGTSAGKAAMDLAAVLSGELETLAGADEDENR